MKLGSDAPSEDEKPKNYTFYRRNYSGKKQKEILPGPVLENNSFTRDLSTRSVISLSSGSLSTGDCSMKDEDENGIKRSKLLHTQSDMGQLLTKIDQAYLPLDPVTKISMWRVSRTELHNSNYVPTTLDSESAKMPLTPVRKPKSIERAESSGSDSGSMIKIRRSYSPKTESSFDDVDKDKVFKKPKTPPSTTSEFGPTPPRSQFYSQKNVECSSNYDYKSCMSSESSSDRQMDLFEDLTSSSSAECTKKQHEIYKYLGIETINNYETKLRQQEEESSKRRSSRVKYLKIKQSADGEQIQETDTTVEISRELSIPGKTQSLNATTEDMSQPPKRKTLLSVTYFPKKPTTFNDDEPEEVNTTNTNEEDFFKLSQNSGKTEVFDFDVHLKTLNSLKVNNSKDSANSKRTPASKKETIVRRVKDNFIKTSFDRLVRSKFRFTYLRSGKTRISNTKYPRRERGPKPVKLRKKPFNTSISSKSNTSLSPKTVPIKKRNESTISCQSIPNVIKINNLYLSMPSKETKDVNAVPRILGGVRNVPTAKVTPLSAQPMTEESSNSMPNPLRREDGPLLRVLVAKGCQIIVVQELAISFWRYERFPSVLGKTPKLEAIGKIKRQSRDTEIQFPTSCDLCYNDDAPVYLELRGEQKLPKECLRQCPLASIYANVYYFDTKKRELALKSIQLDSIFGVTTDVRFIILSGRYFITSWYQLSAENNNRSGLCKYSLTPDLETLASIKNFPTVDYKILSLSLLAEDRIVGIGETNVTIWNYNGDKLNSVGLTNRIGRNLACVDYTVVNDKYLFLINLLHEDDHSEHMRTLKIVGIDLFASQNASRIVTSLQLDIKNDDPATINVIVSRKHDLCMITFQNGQYILISLNNLQTIHHSFIRPLESIGDKFSMNNNLDNTSSDCLTVFNSNNFLMHFSKDRMMIKDVSQFLLESLK